MSINEFEYLKVGPNSVPLRVHGGNALTGKPVIEADERDSARRRKLKSVQITTMPTLLRDKNQK